MSTLTKLVLGAMGALRPAPALGDSTRRLELPPAQRDQPGALMQALSLRCSTRAFRPDPLPRQMLANLLWAADGVNREDGRRTAPSALGVNEIVVVAALPEGAYAYDPAAHALNLLAAADIRRVTGYQDFVDEAPLDLVFVADHDRMSHIPVTQREGFAYVAAGAISQNVSLYCAANGLATVLRAWIDREAIARALGLGMSQHVLLSQTVGHPG
ncbi:MAG TPA: nitroreductase family protein [Ideonella sp.]|uniref:nitroreductase family protein n=1 Tax=Ideonella sp. TaxID=1929293 RepID=UPI002E37AFEA|nr:nitroreductase family protein [Ideonella sp.]HEX5685548.1 nitroreductase family protein [Ideonella sp.]